MSATQIAAAEGTGIPNRAPGHNDIRGADMDDGFVIPQPTVEQARDDLDRVRQAYLVNVRLAVTNGVPAPELLDDIDGCHSAALQIVELLR